MTILHCDRCNSLFFVALTSLPAPTCPDCLRADSVAASESTFLRTIPRIASTLRYLTVNSIDTLLACFLLLLATCLLPAVALYRLAIAILFRRRWL